jgi:ferredoxin
VKRDANSAMLKYGCVNFIHSKRLFSDVNNAGDNRAKELVNFTFKYLADGKEVNITSEVGNNILKAAHENKVDIEGACDCSLACSTCHVILDQDIFDSIPQAEEVEDDLLDLAFGLTHTSRLGCQVLLTKQFEGKIIEIPSATKNLYVDGHKPQPH